MRLTHIHTHTHIYNIIKVVFTHTHTHLVDFKAKIKQEDIAGVQRGPVQCHLLDLHFFLENGRALV